MFTGWKAIQGLTGFSRGTLKSLAEEEGFPIVYIRGRPVTTRKLVEDWIEKIWIKERRLKNEKR